MVQTSLAMRATMWLSKAFLFLCFIFNLWCTYPSIGLLPSDIVYSMLLDGTPCHCSRALSAGTRCSLPLPKDIIGDRDGSIFIFEMILTTITVKLSGK